MNAAARASDDAVGIAAIFGTGWLALVIGHGMGL